MSGDERNDARPRILILVLAASLVLAACRVDATVGVTMRGDGSGRVSVRLHLDPAAVRAVEVDGRRLDFMVDTGASVIEVGETSYGHIHRQPRWTLTVAP